MLELLKFRASQIDGYGCCLHMHTRDAWQTARGGEENIVKLIVAGAISGRSR